MLRPWRFTRMDKTVTVEMIPESLKAADDAKAVMRDIVTDLAKLDAIDYDQCRIQKAEALGIRVGTLDAEVDKLRVKPESVDEGRMLLLTDPEPWPETVDLTLLLNAIMTA